MRQISAAAPRSRLFSGQRLFLLATLASGHTLMHCFQQGWYIVLPLAKEHFGFSDVAYGAVETTRSASSTAVNIPSGAVSDILKKQWVIIVASALVGLGAAYIALGLAPNYATILVAAILVGISVSLWHPPALSVLSARLAEQRGLALSIHGMGGNLGNAIGPFGLGVIIGATTWLTWERVSVIMGIPLLFLAVVLWLVLRRVPGREGKPVQVGQYFSSLAGLLKNKVMLGLVISGGIRAMGTGSIFAFFSLYCKEELGFSIFKTGVYYTMMMASGIASQPVLGWLSDKLGRKAVMVPSLFIMGVLVIILVWSGSGVGLAIVALGIGLFIYSVGAIIQAAAMDATPEQTGAMTIALLFGSSALFTIPSPTIAGWLSETYGTASVFLYSGALVLLSVLILVFIPIPRPRKGAKVSGG